MTSRSANTALVPALCLFIEPAPYIAKLDEELHQQWLGPVASLYIAESMSQNWQYTPGAGARRILPNGLRAALQMLWQEMRESRPRVVFVAGWSHPIVIAAIVMARVTGARVVAFSDTWVSESTGLRAMGRRTVLRMIHRFAPGGQRQAAFLQNLGVPGDHVFLANMTVDTAALRDYIVTSGPAQRKTIREELGLAKGAPLYLFVGRLEPVKGLDILIAAFAELPREMQAHLVIVGDGSMRPMVEQAAAQESRIIFRGRLEGRSLLAQFAAADVFVAPSRVEPWGLVVNEALTAGLAVVLSNRFGCINDLVRPGENGLIVPAEDVRALSEALQRLANDPTLLARLRANAPQATEGWTSQAWAANVIVAWRDALERDRNLTGLET